MLHALGFSQSINFDQVGKEKWLRYNGGVAANAVYYDGTANRQNLTYYLTGNLNFNIAGLYSIPLSFTYSNQEFDFPNPFKFNRLSLHPSYKWAMAHIGDVSMTFSPYTLAGHQFTGGGFDLNPKGKFQVSAMYGRFLKATEYNFEEPLAIAAYKRMGYGMKAAYDFDFMKLGVILLKVGDEDSSIGTSFPIELELSPKDNAVVSFETQFSVFEKAQIRVEYAISGVTEDSRLTATPLKSGLLSFLLKENISSNYYSALNASFDYPAGNGTLGIGYKRIDPDYKTLGAYYFNNDLENITINASQTLFDNKLNFSVNAGLQQNNLDKAKSSDQQRIVSSVNAKLTASERLGINSSYSNFQSYTNIRDQFDYINQVGVLDNVDTLNYRQISQNANLGINYVVKKTEAKQHSTSLNLVYHNSINQQEGETIEGGDNSFYNGVAAYTLGYPKLAFNISLAGNASYNTIAEANHLTLGPTLAIGKQFFEKKLRTNFSSSYNSAFTNGANRNNVYNFRLGSNYSLLQKHNISLNFMALFRNSVLNTGRDLTITFGYSYAFDNFKLQIESGNRGRSHDELLSRENTLSFRYRDVSYSGAIYELNEQLTNVYESSGFTDIPQFKKDDLKILLATVKEQTKQENYKEKALIFLKELYAFDDFKEVYDDALFNVIAKIQEDMLELDMALEKLFVIKKLEADKHPLNGKAKSRYTEKDKALAEGYQALLTDEQTRLEKLVGHRWIENQFAAYDSRQVIESPKGYLKSFKEAMATQAFLQYDNIADPTELEKYLEIQIIDFYYKKSLNTVNPDLFELKYIDKN
ncbi:TonB-dependent receptor [Kriegella aquimaris]|uniref:Uncharacterized protein n=1 Tax=Kriegella aquimaris TaxID=192904 RepID=A0A1G9LVJ0_9FLAO|nr:hypothetical protein [Kriegella aquimaris]SDL66040.1 hypothetical protein SAMN04488514_102251 [Kriegella aquimaris]